MIEPNRTPSSPPEEAPRRPAPGPSRRALTRSVWGFGLAVVVAVVAVVAGTGVAAADANRDPFRYPYDPVCSWGRVANGKGMIVRCLTRAEAEALVASGSAGQDSRAVASAAPPAAPSASSPAAPPTRSLAIEVGPVTVDSGKLPLALPKLKIPADRYLACVRDHGGLQRSTGEIQIRFLVRERGRAEGAVVSRRVAVSEATARCVADVVDRRFVGHPEAPMVGATLTVKVRESTP